MQNIESYNILRNRKAIGKIVNNQGNMMVIFKPGLKLNEYPIYFHKGIFNRQYTFGNEDTTKWIESRVITPTRQDISEILNGMNLKKYDPWEMFKKYKGKAGDTISITVNRDRRSRRILGVMNAKPLGRPAASGIFKKKSVKNLLVRDISKNESKEESDQ